MSMSEQDLSQMGFQIVDGRAIRIGPGRPLAGPTAHERQAGKGVVATPPPKYRNKPCYVGHEHFDSQHEAECWIALGIQQQAGQIWDLKRQVEFALHAPIGRGSVLAPVGKYVADFTWRDVDQRLHVGDAKGGKATQTQLFAWKVKHLNIEYGIEIEIL